MIDLIGFKGLFKTIEKGFKPLYMAGPGEGDNQDGFAKTVYQQLMIRKKRPLTDGSMPEKNDFSTGFEKVNPIPNINGAVASNVSDSNFDSAYGFAKYFKYMLVPLGVYTYSEGGCFNCMAPYEASGVTEPGYGTFANRQGTGANDWGDVYYPAVHSNWNGSSPRFMNHQFATGAQNSIGDPGLVDTLNGIQGWASYYGQYKWRWEPKGNDPFMVDWIEIGYMGEIDFNDRADFNCNPNGSQDCTAESWQIRANIPANSAQGGRCCTIFFGLQALQGGTLYGYNTAVLENGDIGRPSWKEGAIWPVTFTQSGQGGCNPN